LIEGLIILGKGKKDQIVLEVTNQIIKG